MGSTVQRTASLHAAKAAGLPTETLLHSDGCFAMPLEPGLT